jgi:hypothetical protein
LTCHRRRGSRVVVELDLVHQLAERHDHDVEVAALGREPLTKSSAAAVGGVEGDDGDVRPGRASCHDGPRFGGGQHDRPGRGRQQRRDDGAADAAAAQQDDGLRFAERSPWVLRFSRRQS